MRAYCQQQTLQALSAKVEVNVCLAITDNGCTWHWGHCHVPTQEHASAPLVPGHGTSLAVLPYKTKNTLHFSTTLPLGSVKP